MAADVYFITRNKELGFYQDDSKNRFVFNVEGRAGYDFLSLLNSFMTVPYGTVVLSKGTNHILETEDELILYFKDKVKGKHFEIYERVDSMYFILLDRYFETWLNSCSGWSYKDIQKVKYQVQGLKEVASRIDFENYYCYVVFTN